MRFICALVFTLILACGQVMAATQAVSTNPNQGVFTSVDGKVEIRGGKGHKVREAKKDSTVIEGEKIVTSDNSTATLKLFDGSELKVSPKTEFGLTKLQKTSVQDKVIQFKLLVGKLFAQVKKLASAKSSFEIEAGGVVCGVRGTSYSVETTQTQNGKSQQVLVQVTDGSVLTTDLDGHHFIINPGPPVKFINGIQFTIPSGQGGTNPNQGNGSTTGLNDLNGQFTNQIKNNGDKNRNDGSVNGVNVNVNVHVSGN